ncbi:putative signal recognition particle receptor like protein [Trypanosoma rangeli]|uniref:Putative signal recognition particle receptor like protein n=1 Tax=Trypanosoma rangeli TaxID=5698 RepID=A0A3R7RBB0_TRYRA|nr:putative signal recognition particle receptor like protein [Trypanosoma rangeli]RNE99248.1 putative signal recognition particle receptor like protein [Trypanosoma rangeli]|eukprot:RNE99248.1 putative signal recognition particle receptor like protein [Trypanosoma rangeli]
MIDTLSVISKGGVVLWERSSDDAGRRLTVNRVIQEVLLEDRAGVPEVTLGDHKVSWALDNDARFFLVCVYPKFLAYPHMGAFLRDLARTFARKYGRIQDGELFADYDLSAEFAAAVAGLDVGGGRPGVGITEDAAPHSHSDAQEEGPTTTAAATDEEEEDNDDVEEAVVAQRGSDRIMTKSGHVIGRKGQKLSVGSASKQAAAKKVQKKGKPVKQATRWEEPALDPALSAQERTPTQEELVAQTEAQRTVFIRRLPNGSAAPVRETEWENQPRGRLASWLRAYVGRRELDRQDFQRVVPSLREKLIAKNVAVEVAEHVCKSVEASLAGTKLGTFDSLHQSIEAAMTSALRRILQPKHEVNILRAVASAQSRKKPYSIVLCGVNGVGKSTTLAKIAYWLQQNGHSIMIAAGDTFRHGAVEQLEVHGRCLGVPVFQMGYGTDPSAVAAAAIAQAARQKYDVVMIDTAGRMQDHESRMRALAKLIHETQPDLVLFVGEALVGNSGVDQLRRFNQCLVDFAPVGTAPRCIDGIVLTKFDTIDDKVGAALSMVYELGQPIVFVGSGQTYQDLKVMQPDVVVSALME